MKTKTNRLIETQGILYKVEHIIKHEIELNKHRINNIDKRYKTNKAIVSILYLRNERYNHIINFIRFIRNGNIDKRFLDLMFGYNLTPYIDMSKLTKAICELVANSRKQFSKK